MSGKDENRKITAIMIIEVMGRPKKHLIKILKEISKEIGEEKEVKIINEKINEPVKVKDQKNLFTAFTEIEVEVDEPLSLVVLIFKYMPAHIEVIEPENFTLTNNGFGEVLNELTRRLHKYEELVKVLQFQIDKNSNRI